MLFWVNVLLILLYMTIWFVVGYRRRRLDTVDTAWGGGFILLALSAHAEARNLRTAVLLVLVLVWGLRLAIYLWRRNLRKGPDQRYDELSQKWPPQHFWRRAYISVFLLQGVLVYVIGLPLTLAGATASQPFGTVAIVGVAVWVIGFTTEALADSQLHRFIRSPHQKGAVLQTGVWRYSRHPNYFGELLQWWGVALIVLPVQFGWIGLIGPLTLTWLIVFVSGIPPIERRKRDNAEYQAYARRTSVLIPRPPRSN
jgi:steroid 5-alpha reductase family enzyme